jgi:hypothetical protein
VSRTELRALLLIAAAAFALRAGAAVLTEFKPIFPAYYYTDAVFVDHDARETIEAWAAGTWLNRSYSAPQRIHILLTALLYRAVGPRPIAAKLANAFIASFGIAAFGLLAGRLFSPAAGLASAAIIGLWPSHVFYTAQNFKEGLVFGVLMSAFLLLTPGVKEPRARELAAAAAGLALLAFLGFFRSHVMLVAAAALAAGACAALRRVGGSRRAAVLALAACLAAPIAYKAAMRAFMGGLITPIVGALDTKTTLIPVIVDPASPETYSPLSPRGITEYRRSSQHYDREYARVQAAREIGTQLFPGERLDTWLDVARFIPKSAFYVLFMPLPGLYPMDGKPGRMLAAAENLVLLSLVVLAVFAAVRGGLAPARLSLLRFFAAMLGGSSLLEFDLGGAGRHKLMYLPMLFPFAAEEALRLLGRWRKA